MRTIEEVERAFAVGWSEVSHVTGYEIVKNKFADMAVALWHLLPNGPEKTLVLRSLWRTQSEAQLSLSVGCSPLGVAPRP